MRNLRTLPMAQSVHEYTSCNPYRGPNQHSTSTLSPTWLNSYAHEAKFYSARYLRDRHVSWRGLSLSAGPPLKGHYFDPLFTYCKGSTYNCFTSLCLFKSSLTRDIHTLTWRLVSALKGSHHQGWLRLISKDKTSRQFNVWNVTCWCEWTVE